MVQVEHLMFALPFAVIGAPSATQGWPGAGRPGHERNPVRPSDMSRVNTALIIINGWISVLLCFTAFIDILWC